VVHLVRRRALVVQTYHLLTRSAVGLALRRMTWVLLAPKGIKLQLYLAQHQEHNQVHIKLIREVYVSTFTLFSNKKKLSY